MVIATRPKSETDKSFVRETHHQAFRDIVIRQFGEWDEAQQDKFFESDWNDPPPEILLCDGIPCGYATIVERPDSIQVHEIVIHPDFQNRGIGSTFLRQIMDRAATRGLKVTLGVFPKNRAVEFYKRLGFVECGRTEIHLLMVWKKTDAS
jgi:ribosomal protein S18 acetylase RimI-like enzyme